MNVFIFHAFPREDKLVKRETSAYALKWRLSIRAAKPQPIQAFVNDDRKRGPHRPRRGHVSQFLGEHGTRRGFAVIYGASGHKRNYYYVH